ncbi:hypothetical protein D6D28_05918 [Aureobasidium pullulans]|uniref:BTB domain-containing protein n=1 Tax=Aureobasidium pullulans TaxID=5580 RepID=A0A4S8SFN0_AURPU|nr:hypothetical protein D6D28_05918 [Aureobasidium pullulans]
MADSPPRSRSVSPTPSWYPDATANGMSLWDTDTFKVHIGDSILQEMWNDRHNADFEIRCGTEKFKVHKAVLRAHSDEALSGVLTLEAHPYKGNIDNLGDGDDPEIVGEMIHYFYHLELSPKANGIIPWECRLVHAEPSLVFMARLYVLAEKYFIEGLKAKVMAGFRGILAHDISHNELNEACRIIFQKTMEPAGERGLKTTVAKCLADELEKVKISTSHDDLLQEIPELAIRVLKEVPKSCVNRSSSDSFCELCGRGPTSRTFGAWGTY